MNATTRPRFLASVRDVVEARLAAALGAEIIDLKEPRHGALGAVPQAEQRRIVAALGDARPTTSATVGDLPFEVGPLVGAIHRTAECGVDYVKFGVFAPDGENLDDLASNDRVFDGFAALDAHLRRDPPRAHLVVLLLADRLRSIDEAVALATRALRTHGVAGVMLDTASKGSIARALPEVFGPAALARFVAAVHAAGGFAGLAGALRVEHIAPLAATQADLLGFRGALCAGARGDALDPTSFARVRDQVFAARAARSASASASKTSVVETSGAPAAMPE